MSGEFYKFLIEDGRNFSTQMVLSGDATGTGKSLLQSVMVRALKGCDKSPTKSCSESEAFWILSRGENIYGEFKILNVTIENKQCQIKKSFSIFYIKAKCV